MGQSESIAFAAAGWKAERSEETVLRRTVLDHYDQDAVQILRYLVFLGVDKESAQDILQEAFLKLHSHLLAGGERTNLRAWLYRVAHNLARTSQVSFRAKRTDPLPEQPTGSDFEAPNPSPEDQLLAEERQHRLREALAQLSRSQRECIVLRTQGLKYREIADILALSVSTVGENIQRGLERLKETV
jgi:RNA polymerase sigma-70 factor, ECF subfamily